MSRKYTKEYLEKIVKTSYSISDTIRKCGGTPSGGMHRHITSYLKEYDINVSHFTGQRWNKGKTFPSKIPNEDVFVKGRYVGRPFVRKRFKKLTKYECENCFNDGNWLGKPISLHMDHKNGDHTDNRFENLRWLCPNCHQQTDSWGSMKIEKQPKKKVERVKKERKIKVKKKRPTKIEWPEVNVLQENVLKTSLETVGKTLGVSGNGVKAFLKRNGIVLPRYHTQSKY